MALEMNYASIFEAIAKLQPEAPALAHGERLLTWRSYEDVSARLARVFHEAGVTAKGQIGLFLYNGPEYNVGMFAAFKLGSAPVNVNYRYQGGEVAYLLDNADAEGLLVHESLADRLSGVLGDLPRLKRIVWVRETPEGRCPDWAVEYEPAIAAAAPLPPIRRTGDELYMLYTGGTTGMPKGVVYDNKTLIANHVAGWAMNGLEVPTNGDEVLAGVLKYREMGITPRALVCAPLMHGTGGWTSLLSMLVGGMTITLEGRHFDPDEAWRAAERWKATGVTIVGDAFAKPMLAALDAAAASGRAYDISSVRGMNSSGVMWSREVKEALLRHGEMRLMDAMGSSEGQMGRSIMERGAAFETAAFDLNPNVKVFTDDDREVLPGSEEIGKVATPNNLPLGYYKDAEKTAKTFRTIAGVRYCFPGDFAKVDAEGKIQLLGRGSMVINTGGEKVFPEEVEEALKTHPAVHDALVVGLKDDRFGERVAAVVEAAAGHQPLAEDLANHVRTRLAGYKVPRAIILVEQVRRAPNGKADYAWAKTRAAEG